jgi:hypothetical protein
MSKWAVKDGLAHQDTFVDMRISTFSRGFCTGFMRVRREMMRSDKKIKIIECSQITNVG